MGLLIGLLILSGVSVATYLIALYVFKRKSDNEKARLEAESGGAQKMAMPVADIDEEEKPKS